MSDARFRYPLWVRGDLDGFFGLMVDNLVQVLTIVVLCNAACGISLELITTRILPGVAISLLIGNLFYGLQAHWVARKTGNPDCTALPYGINTPSVFAFALFVMAPVFHNFKQALGPEAAADLAWKAGMLACLVSGVIEFCGAFVAERLRRITPRAALLGVLAAVGITFIASDFAFRIYAHPLVGLLPLGILLLAYFGHFRFPWGLPGGLLVVAFGTVLAWGGSLAGLEWLGGVHMSVENLRAAIDRIGWIAPVFAGEELRAVLGHKELLLPFLTVSVPMGLLNVLGSLQNIESAEAAGDRFATAPSLAVNGLGTIAAALFGSCFPTTIYIGHPGWKAMGARAGYSILNGAFFTLLFLFGWGTFVSELIPIEAGAPIVMYIGIVITAQAFQATPRRHAPAVAIALFPALAAMITVKLPLFLSDAGARVTIAELVNRSLAGQSSVPELPGILALFGANAGWLVSGLILTAITVALIDRKYRAAAGWCAAATVLTAIGLLHSFRVEGNVIREYFIWQPAPAAAINRAPATAADDQPAAGAATSPSAAATAPAPASAPAAQSGAVSIEAAGPTPPPPVYADRAWPITIGYALATVLFALAARRPGEPMQGHDDLPTQGE